MTKVNLSVRRIAEKGRGVFTNLPIAAGDVLERAPALELDAPATDAIASTTLDNYYFAHPADPEGGLMVLGLSTLLNHSEMPNTQTTAAFDRHVGWTVTLRALRAIPAGEELTRRYSCAVWFDPV
ncbi:SET domain-containing protein-lysine N-methyltransferase [Roseovarius rhodophyticola]|uniref:SET domain-containing protein-lysine N-methyltransferase n=1 Tax=Roseovarius rhodophyticola TaxID=3080827 RepID=A0ABZ2TEN6_9RHOB|nr:SET domain-containing protein-lysine N-methyltransferase [Roseovarius sp. W115]MDV2928421.1 SET domain-containing protein-lysine N-methyltransferase [Roseovarius sp. W115]